MLAVWALIACSRGPTIVEVSPTEVPAGEKLSIVGTQFSQTISASLTRPDGTHYPLDLLSITETNLEGRVPLYANPGIYDLVVWTEEVATGKPGMVTILPTRTEIPCTGQYTANTRLSLIKREFTLDRYYRDGRHETLKIAVDEIERIEYELRPLEIGQCSIIYLYRKDGARIVFDDDGKVELKDRAKKMAKDLKLPFEELAPGSGPSLPG